MELDKAAAIVDEAGRDAACEADAIGGERAEGAARQLAQAPLQGRQRGDQGPCQPGVVVQVQVAQALSICQGAEDIQSRALRIKCPHCTSSLDKCVKDFGTFSASEPDHVQIEDHEVMTHSYASEMQALPFRPGVLRER